MFVTPAFNRDPALIATQRLFEEIWYLHFCMVAIVIVCNNTCYAAVVSPGCIEMNIVVGR